MRWKSSTSSWNVAHRELISTTPGLFSIRSASQLDKLGERNKKEAAADERVLIRKGGGGAEAARCLTCLLSGSRGRIGQSGGGHMDSAEG